MRSRVFAKGRAGARSRVLPLLLAAAFGLSGCVTAGGPGGTSSAMDRAIGQCFATAVITTGVGALLGAATDGRNGAGRGALIGAGVGAGACAVLMQVAASEDRAAIRAAELRALDAGAARTETFRAKSGKAVSVRTEVAPAPVPRSASPRNAARKSAAKPAPRPSAAPASTELSAAAPASNAFTDCRKSSQTVSVEGQDASASAQTWCRRGNGEWEEVRA